MSNCQELHQSLRAGKEPAEAHYAHAEGCAACAELLAAEAELGQALVAAESEERSAASQADLTNMHELIASGETGLGKLRGLGSGARVALAGLIVVALFAYVAVFKLRLDIDVYPRLRLYAATATYLVLCAALLRLGLWRMHRALPPRRVELALLGLGMLVPLAFTALPRAHVAHPASLGGDAADLVPRALACFLFGMGIAVVAGAAAWVLHRAPGTSRSLFVVLGGGLLGVGALEIHCALTAPVHLGAGHATVALAAGALGVGLWRRARRRLLSTDP